MSQRQRNRLMPAAIALVTSLVGSAVHAQAPPRPDQPWPIPSWASDRAASHDARVSGFARWARSMRAGRSYGLGTHCCGPISPAAAAAIGLVESAYLPQLSLQAIGGFEHTPLPAPKNLVPKGFFVSDAREFIPSLAVKWLLFDFGRRDANLTAAKADSFVADAAFTAVHQKIVLEVSQTYFSLGAARGRLRAADKALATAQTVEKSTQSKRDHGLATITALAQAQRQTAQARYGVAAAQGAERTAMANLVAALGIAVATPIEVVDSSDQPLPPSPQESITAAVNAAMAHRPDIIAALGMVDSAAAKLKAAERSRYPTIELSAHAFENFGSLSSDGGPQSSVNRPGRNILFSFSVPLFDGGERSSRISIARAQVRESEAKLAQMRDTAAQQVVRAYDELLTGLAEYDAADALLRAANTSYDAALRAYQQGVGTYTEVATEESAVADAERQVEDARAGTHSAAAGLVFAMGITAGQGP